MLRSTGYRRWKWVTPTLGLDRRAPETCGRELCIGGRHPLARVGKSAKARWEAGKRDDLERGKLRVRQMPIRLAVCGPPRSLDRGEPIIERILNMNAVRQRSGDDSLQFLSPLSCARHAGGNRKRLLNRHCEAIHTTYVTSKIATRNIPSFLLASSSFADCQRVTPALAIPFLDMRAAR